MKQQEVFKKIGGIIRELNEQYEYLKTVEGELNELELELFLANSHFLGDHVAILTRLNSQNITRKNNETPQAPKSQNFFEPLVQTPVTAPQNKETETFFELAKSGEDTPAPQIDLTPDAGDNYSYTRDEEPETIRHELIMDEADWADEDEAYENETPTNADILAARIKELEAGTKAEMVIEPEPIEEITTVEEIAPPVVEEAIPQKEEPAIIAYEPVKPVPEIHTVKDEVLTINQKMSAQIAEKSGHTDQPHIQKISDLKQGITLNDKLLFVKDLFNGYSLAYSEAIEILNRFNSIEEADTFLKKNYVVKNNWESKTATVEKLYSLLNRRYA